MRSSKIPDAKLINLFLDMLAAEQGAGDNTLDAYRRDLTDFSEFLAPTGQGFAGVDPVRSEARPGVAESAVNIGRRSSAGARQGADGGAGCLCTAGASRHAAVLPAGSALCHRLAGVGTGGAAALGGATRRAHDRGARQGQQGTAGAVERGFATGDGRLPRRDRSPQVGKEEKHGELEMAVSLIRRERASDAAAFRARPERAGGIRRPGAAAGLSAYAASCVREPSFA